MCRQMRGKIRLFFSYLSILVIGILIYLIVLFVADKHRRDNELRADSLLNPSATKFANSNESSKTSNVILSEGTNKSNTESSSVVDKESLNELPNEINVAINTLDSPNSLPKNASAFPRDFIVNTRVLRIRTEPNTNSEVLKLFKEGAVIRISRIEDKWAELENGGWAYLPLLKEHK